MNNEEKAKKIKEALKEQDVFCVKSVENINFKPHPYMIGPIHISYASDHYGGMLGDETLKAVRCAHPNCNIPYEQHTSDNVCFLQLLRNATNEEANVILKSLVETIGQSLVDGFAFVETEEKFRIS